MKHQEIDLFKLSDIHFRITTLFEEDKSFRAVVVHFQGEYGHGSQGNGDGRFMAAVTHAALQALQADGLVLDLQELEYEWGDLIIRAILAGRNERDEWNTPTALVVSQRCEKGITSLLVCVHLQPTNHISPTVEEAYEKVKALSKGR
jgi:hypothetical protein